MHRYMCLTALEFQLTQICMSMCEYRSQVSTMHVHTLSPSETHTAHTHTLILPQLVDMYLSSHTRHGACTHIDKRTRHTHMHLPCRSLWTCACPQSKDACTCPNRRRWGPSQRGWPAYMSMCVCLYSYMYVYIYIYCIHTCIYIYIYIYVYRGIIFMHAYDYLQGMAQTHAVDMKNLTITVVHVSFHMQ
jgi:hypothetical protein